MVLLIDGFNLIYKFPDLELYMYEDRLEEAKNGLIEILKEVNMKSTELKFVVFIDGNKMRGDRDTLQEDRDGIRIYYSHEKEADDLIRGYIKENPNPNHLTLVTSDKKIIQFAKQFKVKCITSEAYSKSVNVLLENKPPDDPNLDKILFIQSDNTEWINTFRENQ